MKKIKGNDLMLVLGKRLKKGLPDKKKTHKCKDCMKKDKKNKY